MYLEHAGSNTNPTIIFLHGAGTTSWMWAAQVEALKDTYHCITVDLPGHGRSNHEEWVSLSDTADQVAGIIRTHATNGRAHVVGLSLGAYTALHLLDRHADCVDRAILSGVTMAPLPNPGPTLLQMQVMSHVIKSPLLIRMQAKMLRIPADAQDAYTEGMLSMTRQAFLAICKEAVYFRAPERLAQVQVPVLIVAGGGEAKPIRDAVMPLAAMLPHGAGRIVAGVHHGWNGEAPEVFNEMLRVWLAGEPLPDDLRVFAPDAAVAA